MKHYRKNLIPDSDLYASLDAHDYAEFDDDYYFDMVDEKIRNRKRKNAESPDDQYNRAFMKYVNEY